MKILVAYYSKTGNTKKIAEKISEILKADLDEISVEGVHIPFKKEIKINYKKDPSNYDLVIVGTPVWAWTSTPAVKEYLIKNKDKIKETAFFCKYGGLYGFTFSKMKKLSKKPIAVLGMNAKEINSPDNKIKDFCDKIKLK